MRPCTSAVTLPPLFHARIDVWRGRECIGTHQRAPLHMYLYGVATRVSQAASLCTISPDGVRNGASWNTLFNASGSAYQPARCPAG